METNRARLREIDLDGARTALEQALDREGFSPEAFAPAFALLDELKGVVNPAVPLSRHIGGRCEGRPRPPAHDRLRDPDRADREPRILREIEPGSSRSGRADDFVRLELRPGESATVVASPADSYQCFNGHF
jgi:hypothetical protein